jgi:hypothetical protein
MERECRESKSMARRRFFVVLHELSVGGFCLKISKRLCACHFTERIGPDLSDDRLQELSEGKQRISGDLGRWREVVLRGRWTDHPGGNLQGHTGGIDHRHGSVPVAWLTDHV